MGDHSGLIDKIYVPYILNSYETYISKELELGTKWARLLCIDDRHDEDEYKVIRLIWGDNTDLIDKIYVDIDNILKGSKYNFELRYLVIGDFLFAISEMDLYKSCNLTLKVSRKDYMKYISIRASIISCLGIEFNWYIKVHQKLLIGLRIEKILTRSLHRSWSSGGFVAEAYYLLNIRSQYVSERFIRGVSKYPFILISVGEVKYFISSFRNVHKALRKKHEFIESEDISYENIAKASRVPFKLSSKIYALNKTLVSEEEARLLKEVGCRNAEEYFDKIKENNAELVEWVEHYKEMNPSKKYEKWGKDRVLSEEEEIIKGFKLLRYKLQSIFQKIMTFKILRDNIYDKTFYLPCFEDNRERGYYYTHLSPTFYIVLRYIYTFGEELEYNYELELAVKGSLHYREVMRYRSSLGSGYSKDLDIKAYFLIVLYIEVGKHFIRNNIDEYFNADKIIRCGIANYKIKNLGKKFNDSLYINKLYEEIDNILKKNIVNPNLIIFKDATASGLQNFGILKGYMREHLVTLNLEGNKWCDVYQYLVNIYLREHRERELWKGTIMTIPYNSTWFSCFLKFISALRKRGVEYCDLDVGAQKALINTHREFYDVLKGGLDTIFYKEEENVIKTFKYKKIKKSIIKEYKVNYKNKRDKYIIKSHIFEDDIEKSDRALKANIMHYLDARLYTYLGRELTIIGIHDCFGVRMGELHKLMDRSNEYYSLYISEKLYALFILI